MAGKQLDESRGINQGLEGDRPKLETSRVSSFSEERQKRIICAVRTFQEGEKRMVTLGEEKEVPCSQCAAPLKRRVIMFGGKEVFGDAMRICKACEDSGITRASLERTRELDSEERQRWLDLCPPLYRDSVPDKLLVSPDILTEVLSWEPSERGIGLTGATGSGKTRLIFLLLHRLFMERHRAFAITAKRFEHCCHRMFDKDDEARSVISRCKSTPILFIDDIGKEKYTERVESEFYDLIETRTAYLKPILWTANFSGDQLRKAMSEDRGAPIVRRLREFCTIYTL